MDKIILLGFCPKLGGRGQESQTLSTIYFNVNITYIFPIILDFSIFLGFLAISRQRTELTEIHWCQHNRIFKGLFRFLHWSPSLSAPRARRTKSKGPKGLQIEVRVRRAPRLALFLHLFVFVRVRGAKTFLAECDAQQGVRMKDNTTSLTGGIQIHEQSGEEYF